MVIVTERNKLVERFIERGWNKEYGEFFVERILDPNEDEGRRRLLRKIAGLPTQGTIIFVREGVRQ